MKNLEFMELNAQELEEVDGGIIPLLIIGAALLLTSCTVNVTVGDNNTVSGQASADSTTVTNGHGSGNKIR